MRRSSARRAVKVEVRSSGILAYQRVPEGVVISGITADGENLYWLNYGTRDHLGNYNNDGALLAYSFQSRVTRTVVAALSGPVDLEVTIAHAYFLEDGGPLNGGVAKPIKLRRVASDGRGVEAATSPRAKPSFRPAHSVVTNSVVVTGVVTRSLEAGFMSTRVDPRRKKSREPEPQIKDRRLCRSARARARLRCWAAGSTGRQ